LKAVMLVAAHRESLIPNDDFYLPVHVGNALNPSAVNYQPDDEGENISALNRSYCELTALYWAWKNLDADVVGLSHYRRYFVGSGTPPHGSTGILTRTEAVELMLAYDVVIGRPRRYLVETVDSHYRHGHYGSDLDHLRCAVERRAPHYGAALNRILQGRSLSLYNMVLMRRHHFDEYCAWLFSVLSDFSEHADLRGRDAYQQRAAGYLGERLLNVWINHHADALRVNRRRIINTEGEPIIAKGLGMIKRKFSPSL
jgi:hypothetical protein